MSVIAMRFWESWPEHLWWLFDRSQRVAFERIRRLLTRQSLESVMPAEGDVLEDSLLPSLMADRQFLLIRVPKAFPFLVYVCLSGGPPEGEQRRTWEELPWGGCVNVSELGLGGESLARCLRGESPDESTWGLTARAIEFFVSHEVCHYACDHVRETVEDIRRTEFESDGLAASELVLEASTPADHEVVAREASMRLRGAFAGFVVGSAGGRRGYPTSGDRWAAVCDRVRVALSKTHGHDFADSVLARVEDENRSTLKRAGIRRPDLFDHV